MITPEQLAPTFAPLDEPTLDFTGITVLRPDFRVRLPLGGHPCARTVFLCARTSADLSPPFRPFRRTKKTP
jgi:hypothetical protein